MDDDIQQYLLYHLWQQSIICYDGRCISSVVYGIWQYHFEIISDMEMQNKNVSDVILESESAEIWYIGYQLRFLPIFKYDAKELIHSKGLRLTL